PAPRPKTIAPPPPPASSALQLLPHDLIDELAVGAALELRHHHAHHPAEIGGAGRDRGPGCGPDLRGIDSRRQKLFEDLDLVELDVCQVVPLGLRELLERFTPELDPLAD